MNDEQRPMAGNDDRTPLDELRAGAALHELSIEEHALLEESGAAAADQSDEAQALGALLLALDAAAPRDTEELPPALAAAITARGRALTGEPPSTHRVASPASASPAPGASASGSVGSRRWSRLAMAALVAALLGGSLISVRLLGQRDRALDTARQQLTELQARVERNQTMLAGARTEAESLDRRNLELAERLSRLTSDLGEARDRIAMFETPVDPELLQFQRERLLDVPDAVQVAWAPFDLGEENLAEQRNVTGDVVWSDEREEGYLRFVGLEPNDPSREQYQVWIIDERGMEQKVSGGVFNATAEGEVIVPIDPGIDVGRVQLFAVTIEEPGGIWVPDLERRVTIAPVERGDSSG